MKSCSSTAADDRGTIPVTVTQHDSNCRELEPQNQVRKRLKVP